LLQALSAYKIVFILIPALVFYGIIVASQSFHPHT
jgi:hypothetical protein